MDRPKRCYSPIGRKFKIVHLVGIISSAFMLKCNWNLCGHVAMFPSCEKLAFGQTLCLDSLILTHLFIS